MTDKLLTRKESAAYLGVSVESLAGWASKGRRGVPLPVTQIGVRVYYRLEDLDAHIERSGKRGVHHIHGLPQEQQGHPWVPPQQINRVITEKENTPIDTKKVDIQTQARRLYLKARSFLESCSPELRVKREEGVHIYYDCTAYAEHLAHYLMIVAGDVWDKTMQEDKKWNLNMLEARLSQADEMFAWGALGCSIDLEVKDKKEKKDE